MAAYNSGYWVFDQNGNFAWDGTGVDKLTYWSLGQPGEVPVYGDWNGDGKAKIGLYVNGTWRHKPIAVIASFVAETLDIAARYDFWRASRDRLSVYAKESERGRIEAALARRVPPRYGRGIPTRCRTGT